MANEGGVNLMKGMGVRTKELEGTGEMKRTGESTMYYDKSIAKEHRRTTFCRPTSFRSYRALHYNRPIKV